MAGSGGVRADITASAKLTPGEDRTIGFVVKDSVGDPVSDFTGWEFGWYILPNLKMARTSSKVILTKTDASGISATAPNVEVSLDPADTITAIRAGTYFYELWRTDVDDVVRLAYGVIQFID